MRFAKYILAIMILTIPIYGQNKMIFSKIIEVYKSNGVVDTINLPDDTLSNFNTNQFMDSGNSSYIIKTSNGTYKYPSSEIMTIVITSMSKNGQATLGNSNVPSEFSLCQNYPNPFNSSTMIKYEIPKAHKVEIAIYDIIGRKLLILVDEVKQPGTYQVNWDASNFSSGVYFYSINAGEYTQTRKMILLK